MPNEKLDPTSRIHWRRVLKWGLRMVALMVVLLTVQIGLLAFPQILLSKEAEAGSVVIHYRGAADPSIAALARVTDDRLRSGGFGDPSNPKDVFFFPNQDLYAFFARLARVHPQAQGFGISFLGNSFVSGPRVEALGERTGRSPEYSVWEGSIPHTVAHEIAHLILIDSIGRKGWLSLPHWKQEGLPEYMANIGLIRADPEASLHDRIEVLLDDGQWSGTRSWDRIHFEAGLMVEFLLEVRGLAFRAALADSISRERTYSEMVEWSRAPRDRSGVPD
jgi:hypothetical protein